MILGELLERIYRAIHADIVDGVITAGDNNTITDSSLTGKYQANKFKGWVAFVSRTTDGAAPQNEYSLISSYVNTGSAELSSNLSANVEANDEYSFCRPDVPLYTLIKLCNDALRGLKRIPLVNTSLTVAASQIRYTLPIGIKGRQPLRVYFRHPTTFVRVPAPNYDIEPAASGSQATLVFKKQSLVLNTTNVFQLYNGWTIVIEYEGIHEPLTTYNSPVNETIADELAVAACVERVMDWKVYPRQRKIDVANWQKAKAKFEEARREHPIQLPIREENHLPIGIFNSFR
jgi:hypothetical protein